MRNLHSTDGKWLNPRFVQYIKCERGSDGKEYFTAVTADGERHRFYNVKYSEEYTAAFAPVVPGNGTVVYAYEDFGSKGIEFFETRIVGWRLGAVMEPCTVQSVDGTVSWVIIEPNGVYEPDKERTYPTREDWEKAVLQRHEEEVDSRAAQYPPGTE